MIVPRTATVLVREPEPQSGSRTARAQDGTWRHGPSRPVADFGSERAYVMLGDPGSGKTTTFQEEARALPDENHYVTARKFLRADLDQHQEWRTKTLFIDGLDEVRARSSNRWKPLDDILERLEQLDYPRVRLSCRFADWYPSDQHELVGEYSDLQILRLDPLTRTDAYRIMEAEGRNTDALSATAYESGIDHFHTNPQLLKLLITGRTGTEAARSKATLFRNACQTMARELNADHQEAALDLRATCPDNIVSAAGQLCAMLLLTGKAHISLYGSEAGDPDDCLLLDDVQGERDVLRISLRTKLFTGATLDQMMPVHSLVAEYLAGRYLADQIDDPKGIPVARVLALMRGPDNDVVPTLRGVAAWLATFVPAVRRRLIKSDPWGVLAYGDSSWFDNKEKELLLTRLAAQDDTAMYFWDLPDLAVAGLVGPDTIRTVRRYMRTRNRSKTAQNSMALVFRGVAARNAGQHDLTVEELLAVATELSWSSRVRITALRAAVATARRSGAVEPLLRALDDIRSGKVSDPDNQLRGSLLRELYPDTVTAEVIWGYFPDDTDAGVSGLNELFWHSLADPERSDSNDVANLLDGLVDQRRYSDWDTEYIATTAWKLLERGVESHGNRIPVQRLYDWIEAVAWNEISEEWRPSSDGVADLNADGSWGFRPLSIRPWLAEHPKVQLALLEEFCRRPVKNLRWQWRTFEHLVCGIAYPVNFLSWCREHAARMATDVPEVARVLVERASANAAEKQQRRQHQRDRELADRVHKHAAELSTGNGPPELLHQLAQAYLGLGRYRWPRDPIDGIEDYFRDWDVSESPSRQESRGPMDRLRHALADDEEAKEIAIRALRLVPRRDDLPDSRQVLELDENNRWHWLIYPLLAAIAEADACGEDVCGKSDDWIARGLVYYALTPLEGRNAPGWVGKLLACRPEAVADALVLVGKSQIRRDVWDGEHLERMAAEDHCAQVAAATALRLGRSFPTRCNGSQAGALQTALQVALRHRASTPDVASEVLKLANSKSEVPGMDVKQMATWLGVGLHLEFDDYVTRVNEFLDGGKIVRLWHLVEFLVRLENDGFGWPTGQDVKALGELVGAIARRCDPWSWTQRDVPTGTTLSASERDSAELAAEKLVEGWTGMLARNPDVAAGMALYDFADRLDAWRHIIEPKYKDWRITHRVAEYKVPCVHDVQQVLRNGLPANPADLAALVMDKLEEFANQIRNGNTDDWRQYWNVDSHGRAMEPRPEDPCRDALLSDLRQRLPTGVNAEPEGHYAEDKRSDIRVAWQDHAIPVEIKKNSHRQLWSAIEKQLIAKYTRDPGASGFGVYLVLWFGAEHTVVPPCGHHSKPSSPEELKRCLEEILTDDQRRTISVVVIDVSCPKP